MSDTEVSIEVEVVLEAHAGCGESPVWDAVGQRLGWVDIGPGEVHVLDPKTGQDRVHVVGRPAGAMAFTSSGDAVVAAADGFLRLDLESGAVTMLAPVEVHLPTAMNDGKCDPSGRFWAGTTSADQARPSGTLYRLDPDGSVNPMLSGIALANGLGWSNDGRRMYYIDSHSHRIDVMDFDAVAGDISNRRPLLQVEEDWGLPDGMTVDAEDHLWMAGWGSSSVFRFSPRGELVARYRLPTSLITSCAFGGAGLDELYVTSASPAPDERQPDDTLAGAIFRLRPGVIGVPMTPFRG